MSAISLKSSTECVCVWALKYTAKGVKIKGIVHTLSEQMKMCVCVCTDQSHLICQADGVCVCDAYIYFTRGSKHKRKPLDTQHAHTTTICHTDMPNMKCKRTRNRILMMLTIDFPNYSPHSLYSTLFSFFCAMIFSFALWWNPQSEASEAPAYVLGMCIKFNDEKYEQSIHNSLRTEFVQNS